MKEEDGKLSLMTLVLLIFVPTFGFGNVTNNTVALGPASIISWIIVAALFFLPLSGFIAELASANRDRSGGIYSWIDCGLGRTWAFIGTWSYFIANLFYLQFVFSRLPVIGSWAIFGENRFNDDNAYMIPYMGIILAIALTWVATKGVKRFSKISDFGGKFTIIATALFIVLAILGYLFGKPSATEFTSATVMPKFDVTYFSTFSWLLFAVAGAEVAGTYINTIRDPNRNFPRGVLIATALVAGAYILGSLAVSLIASPEMLKAAGLKDAQYLVYKIIAENWGINGKIAVQIYSVVLLITGVAAYVLWMESPIRAMFADVPDGTFPRFFTVKDKDGMLTNALWVQCAIAVMLIAIPLIGLDSIDSFFKLITDLSSLSLVVPYIVLILAYIGFRAKGTPAPFTMFKSNAIAYGAAGLSLLLAVAGFFGAGLDFVVGAESKTEAIKAIATTYGGPIVLIVAGLLLTGLTQRAYGRAARK